ncbi:MAG: hypothetical protein ACJ8R9_27540 [Steroidobacteraceae bacterium]
MSSAAVLVDLARPEAPDNAVTVLSIDMPSEKALWPRVQWESSKKIIVQLPAKANVAVQMANFQNIEIQVRFCPGDPTERERWAAYRAAHHKWTRDMAAWSQMRNRDSASQSSKPVAPQPPEGRAPDSACAL